VTLHIPIPENLEEALVRRLDKEAREAVAIRLYQEERLSHGQLAKYLGIGRGQVDEVLVRHGVGDEFTASEIAEQARALRHFRDGGSASR
jgi:predicted HTH domain antitoxin